MLKEEGGLGIVDFGVLDEVAAMRDVTKLWEVNGSAWATWMNHQYIKNKSLEEVLPKQGDSSGWKAILKGKELIRSYAVLGPRNQTRWVGKGEGLTSKNIFQTLRRRGSFDELAPCI